MEVVTIFLLGWLLMILLMTGMWLIQRKTGDAGIVDVAWSYGLGILVVLYALTLEGDPVRRLVVALAVALWSIRLGTYVWIRIHGKPEDGRYQSLRKSWGDQFQRKIFGFYQMQGLSDSLLSLPLLAILSNPAPFGLWDVLGVVLILVSVIGESVADAQLSRWRKDPVNKGKTCRAGLWAYSRHPNYFFEWLHWASYPILGVALYAGGLGWWWFLTLFSPLLMLHFILNVTGIPATERQALRSRGDNYRRYQAEVSAFVPWFPKRTGKV